MAEQEKTTCTSPDSIGSGRLGRPGRRQDDGLIWTRISSRLRQGLRTKTLTPGTMPVCSNTQLYTAAIYMFCRTAQVFYGHKNLVFNCQRSLHLYRWPTDFFPCKVSITLAGKQEEARVVCVCARVYSQSSLNSSSTVQARAEYCRHCVRLLAVITSFRLQTGL